MLFYNALLVTYSFIPEIFLTTSILAQLLYNTILRKNETFSYNYKNKLVFFQTFFILLITYILYEVSEIYVMSSSLILYNTYGTFLLKKVIILFSIVALVPVANAFFLQSLNFFEFYTLFLFSILASLLLVSASDFLTIYLLIEMQSLCFYVLATFRKNIIFSAQAGVKYYIFGSVVSCILLFAFSLLYGTTGTLNLYSLNILFFSFPFSADLAGINYISSFSILLIVLVFLFKLGIFPFHFWVPDVYEGAPISATIIFSYLPKIVLFDLLLKITHVFGDLTILKIMFIVMGLGTILVGSFLAFYSYKLKQFLICSSISQIGFPLILLGSSNTEIKSSIYFFIIFYLISTLLSWIVYVITYHSFSKNRSFEKEEMETPLYISDISTVFIFDYRFAFILAILFFSIAGIPPFTGFLSKFIIIFDLIMSKNYELSTFLLFSSLISVGYYVRLIKLIFFEFNFFKHNNTTYFVDSSNDLYYLQFLFLVGGVLLLASSFLFLDSWLLFSKTLYFSLYF